MNRTLLRLAGCATALLLAGCASSGTPAVVTTTQTPVDATPIGGGTLMLTRHEGSYSSVAEAPAERVWRALQQVYVELQIPVSGVDSAGHVLRSEGVRLRRVGKTGVGYLFNCPGAYENLAASGDVTADVTSWLVPVGGERTELRTRAVAVAQALTSSQRTNCSSTGRLEQMVATRLQQLLAPPQP